MEVKIEKPTSSPSGQIPPIDLPLEKLNTALREAFDLFESCAIECMPIKETGKAIRDGRLLSGDRISIGLQKKYLSYSTMSTLINYMRDKCERGNSDTFTFDPDDQRLISFEHEGVPIDIHIIEKKWKFLHSPEAVMYNFDYFILPNPYEAYYKSRFLFR